MNPHVFTEQGVAMLSAVLNSKIAIDVSIQIMIAFVAMRKQKERIGRGEDGGSLLNSIK